MKDNWKDSFLPQVGVVYNLNSRDQIFTSYSENMALPRGADDVFSAASPTVAGPDPETSKNLELGYRANRPTFNASVVVYKTTFKNRLQQFNTVVPGGNGAVESFFQNVGRGRRARASSSAANGNPICWAARSISTPTPRTTNRSSRTTSSTYRASATGGADHLC
jgi:iron complex outermembrane receptor protein